MRKTRTDQISIFDLFSNHDIGQRRTCLTNTKYSHVEHTDRPCMVY